MEVKSFKDWLAKIPRAEYVDVLDYLTSDEIEGSKALEDFPEEALEGLGKPIDGIWIASDGGIDWNLIMIRFTKGYLVFGGASLRPTEEYYRGPSFTKACREVLEHMVMDEWIAKPALRNSIKELPDALRKELERALAVRPKSEW